MLVIPISSIPSQVFGTVLAAQACTISIYAKFSGLFVDLSVSNALVIGGVICLNGVKIVRDNYLGFVGDLAFFDLTGTDDPTVSGLGTRFVLMYLEAADVAAGVGS